MVRHPLFMLVQQTLNMERLLDNPRDIQIYFEYDGLSVPYFAQGWEELFIKSNSVERAIYSIYYQGKKRVQFLSANDYLKNHKFIEIPFELFVKNPENFMRIICQFLDTRYSNLTEREMKRQKVPRENIVDGLPLDIYERCGWQPPESGLSEQDEFDKRRDYAVANGAGSESLSTLDQLSEEYENILLI